MSAPRDGFGYVIALSVACGAVALILLCGALQ